MKKRIERDVEDSSFVITTYTGIHNHPIPSVGYYNKMDAPLMVSHNYDCTSSQSSFS